MYGPFSMCLAQQSASSFSWTPKKKRNWYSLQMCNILYPTRQWSFKHLFTWPVLYCYSIDLILATTGCTETQSWHSKLNEQCDHFSSPLCRIALHRRYFFFEINIVNTYFVSRKSSFCVHHAGRWFDRRRLLQTHPLQSNVGHESWRELHTSYRQIRFFWCCVDHSCHLPRLVARSSRIYAVPRALICNHIHRPITQRGVWSSCCTSLSFRGSPFWSPSKAANILRKGMVSKEETSCHAWIMKREMDTWQTLAFGQPSFEKFFIWT